MKSPTIVAPATAIGGGSIAGVRLSGSDSIDIVNTVFKGKDLTALNGYSGAFGELIDERGDPLQVENLLADGLGSREETEGRRRVLFEDESFGLVLGQGRQEAVQLGHEVVLDVSGAKCRDAKRFVGRRVPGAHPHDVVLDGSRRPNVGA